MSKIKFEYNLTKDAYNYARIILFSTPLGASKNLDLIPEKVQKEVKKSYKIHPINHSKLIEMSSHKIFEPIIAYLNAKIENEVLDYNKRLLETEWESIENKYFQRLSELLQKTVYPANYTCYLTTLYSCPYSEKGNWFMVSAFSSLSNQIYVICHEFMHLQFIHWYKNYCLKRKLTDKEFWHIKEVMTFLLNEPEFREIIPFQDKGYLIHRQLKKRLEKLWKKDKNFKVFLDEVIARKQDYF